MIEPALIPADVCSRRGIQQLNEMLARLAERKVDQIFLQEPESGFRLSNYIRAYCQTFVRRSLCLFESAYGLFFTENGLVSLICVRSIYETVASFCHFEKQLQAQLATSDLDAIFVFVKTKAHSTRAVNLLQLHGEHLKSVNISTQLEKMKPVYPKIMEDYEFLCEHTHPNSLGSFHFFGSNPDANDMVTFSDGGQDPRADLQWVLVGCNMLKYLEAALLRIEAELPALSRKGREASPLLKPAPKEG